MCVDIDFRSLSDLKAETIDLRHDRKNYVVVITFFSSSEFCCMCSLIDIITRQMTTNKVRLLF